MIVCEIAETVGVILEEIGIQYCKCKRQHRTLNSSFAVLNAYFFQNHTYCFSD